MTHKTMHISSDYGNKMRAVVLASHHNRNKPRNKPSQYVRQESKFDSKSYRDALQRAFNNAKLKIFFNPDMQYFVTLTYKGKNHTPEQVLSDVKRLVQNEKRKKSKVIKYAYVMEYQKRGSIHVHMIANDFFTTHQNQNGYRSLSLWKHGYSSILHIDNFDRNFKPYLYLFKYMRKAERIGKTFVHCSRNLNNYTSHKYMNLNLEQFTELTREYSQTVIGEQKLHFYRYFLEQYD